MTSIESYYNFITKINRNNTQGNVYCDIATYVSIYNRQQDKWVDDKLKEKDSVLIDDLQEIVKSKIETNKTSTTDYDEYELAEDWFQFISGTVSAKQDVCKRNLNLRPIKNQNVQIQTFDDSLQPSFDYEWTMYTLQNDKIRVYKKDFKTESISYTYYKVIPSIDIEGYIKIDNTASTNINPILKDRFVDEIIDMSVTEFFRNTQNQVGYQAAKERELNK